MIELGATPLLKVDVYGVPLLVQRIKYLYVSYFLELTFFDGRKGKCEPDMLLRYPPAITDNTLTPEQLEDAYAAAQGGQGVVLWGILND